MGSGFMDRHRDEGIVVDETVVPIEYKGHFTEAVQSQIINPRGRVTVEMYDGRGRMVHREQKENFISKLWAISARSWQRTAWSSFPLNEVLSMENINSLISGRVPWLFPNESLAMWNDASAEAPLTEHRVVADAQGLVGFASRNPVGSPAQKRGVVNITDTYWDQNGEFQVYDWPTTAGNGTFQSVGYTLVVGGETLGRLMSRPSMVDRRYIYYPGSLSVYCLGTETTYFRPGLGKFDASGNWVIPFRQVGLALHGCMIVTPAQLSSGLSYDSYGAAQVSISPTILWNNVASPWALASPTQTMLGEYAGYYWMAGYLGSPVNGSGIVRVDKGTGAYDRMVANVAFANGGSNPNSFNARGVIIGSNLYITAGSANPDIYRYDLTANPPTLSATIAPQYPALWPSSTVTEVTTDGTDLYLSHGSGGILKINTSGVRLAEEGWYRGTGQIVESGSNPYQNPGIYRQASTMFDPITLSKNGGGTPSGSAGASPSFRGVHGIGGAGGYIAHYAGERWFFGPVSSQTTGVSLVLAASAAGWNLGSRVKLDSPITKSSGNTMKISYEVSLPSMLG